MIWWAVERSDGCRHGTGPSMPDQRDQCAGMARHALTAPLGRGCFVSESSAAERSPPTSRKGRGNLFANAVPGACARVPVPSPAIVCGSKSIGWSGMRTLAVALALVCAVTLAPTRAMAQSVRADPGSSVVVVQQVSLAEAAMASCAGGAMIGYLLVVATGPGSPTATAALFCGLSAAATVTSSVTFWAWRSVTGWLP